MTSQLEKELNLPSLEEALAQAKASKLEEEQHQIEETEKELEAIKEESPQTAQQFVSALEKSRELDKQLADHQGLMEHDTDMDKISDEAMVAFKDLMDLGNNVSPAHSGKIFETATNLLRLAMDAKNSKSDKKLKIWKLQLDQTRVLRDIEKENGINGNIEGETVITVDRNMLLEQLAEINKNKEKAK